MASSDSCDEPILVRQDFVAVVVWKNTSIGITKH